MSASLPLQKPHLIVVFCFAVALATHHPALHWFILKKRSAVSEYFLCNDSLQAAAGADALFYDVRALRVGTG